MSANIGTRTNDASQGSAPATHESTGVLIRRICPACREPRVPGKSHTKCSRRLQGMYERGEL